MGTTRQTRHSWPWRVDSIHGARDRGGQRAWISANPVGLSQRRSGGLESAAIRRAWVSGDPVAWSPANGAPGGAATREPAGGLGRAIAGGGYFPRSAGMRASRPECSRHSRRSRRTPTPSCSGLRREDEWRLPCHGTDKQEQIKTFQKMNKTKRGEGAPLTVRSGLLSRCTHEGGTRTRRRGRKLK